MHACKHTVAMAEEQRPPPAPPECTKRFLTFAEALSLAQSLGLAHMAEWQAWGKSGARPPNVPARPDAAYKHVGWQGWGHWLSNKQRTRNMVKVLPQN